MAELLHGHPPDHKSSDIYPQREYIPYGLINWFIWKNILKEVKKKCQNDVEIYFLSKKKSFKEEMSSIVLNVYLFIYVLLL